MEKYYTIVIVADTITTAVLAWLAARHWYQSCYQPIVDALLAENRKLKAQNDKYIADMNITPDILGMNITEPEDVDPGYDRWLQEHPEVEQLVFRRGADIEKLPEWDKRPETNPYPVSDVRHSQWTREPMHVPDHKLSSEELYGPDRRTSGMHQP